VGCPIGLDGTFRKIGKKDLVAAFPWQIMLKRVFFYNPWPGLKRNGSADLGLLVKIGGNDLFVIGAVGVLVAVVIQDQGLDDVTLRFAQVFFQDSEAKLNVVVYLEKLPAVDVQLVLPNRVTDLHQAIGARPGYGVAVKAAFHENDRHDQIGVEPVLSTLLENRSSDLGKFGCLQAENIFLEEVKIGFGNGFLMSADPIVKYGDGFLQCLDSFLIFNLPC
jgi:hypothetical protein